MEDSKWPINKHEIGLLNIANAKDEKAAAEAMRRLKGINKTYHWCHDWDLLAISDDHDEWNSCTCFK